MVMDTCCASGSRRSCAAWAIGNALGGADLVAAIVDPQHQALVRESIQRELECGGNTAVLPVEDLASPVLQHFCSRHGVATDEPFGEDLGQMRQLLSRIGENQPGVRRGVLLWHGVDSALHKGNRQFEGVIETLCAALAAEAESSGLPRRVIMVGGEELLRRLEQMDSPWLEAIRFRYILVK